MLPAVAVGKPSDVPSGKPFDVRRLFVAGGRSASPRAKTVCRAVMVVMYMYTIVARNVPNHGVDAKQSSKDEIGIV